MKLTKNQKDIVKNIADGNITDILSFIKHYNLGQEICFNKSAIENKFNEIYENKTFLCDSTHFKNFNRTDRIVNTVDSKTAYCKPRLTFDGPYCNFSCNDIKNSYHLFEPVYIINQKKDIISFIALWQYLKTQALIIELPKSCSKEDMALFLKQKDSGTCYHIPLDDNRTTPYGHNDLDISFSEFFNGKYELDRDNFEICLPYLMQKIYPAPELNTFIQKGYNTNEELNNRSNFLIALAGVIIAIFTSLASIFMSSQERGYYKELNEINQSLQKIERAIDKETNNTTTGETYSFDFDNINNSLSETESDTSISDNTP